MVRSSSGMCAVAALGFASIASADAILSYTYSDLNGSYDAGSAIFSAMADSRTSGDVTRLTGSGGTAEFLNGFYGTDMGDFALEIDVTNNNGSTADGQGWFLVTDANGDTISGLIEGTWIKGAFGTVFFNGQLSNVFINDNSGDAKFNGSSTGHFSTSFQGPIAPFEGALVQLFISSAGQFMTKSFSDVPTLVSAEIIPAPGTIALAVVGGAVAFRRRR
ncbi:MAG: hypothetical protein KIS87_09645 [Phycisphaeraceae bacterium]|nr:hypothetical protein [Phycisphaeraceae bacterium]